MTILATVSTLRCQHHGDRPRCPATVSGSPESGNRKADRSAHLAADRADWAQDARGWLCPAHQFDTP